jgi:glucose-1-phosphate thymidylyltransferase
MQAVILAAGEGQRLRPFTANKPKVMIKVANKPILEFVVNALKEAGIQDIIIVVGYKRHRIIEYFRDGKNFGVRIQYAFQDQQLGTAHALKQAESLIESDEFLVLAGDNIVDSKSIQALRQTWSLSYKVSNEPTKYGVLITENGKVKEIVEKPKEPISNLVNTGMYRLGKDVFDWIGDNTDLISVINEMIKNGYEFRCVEANLWMDIVYPWDIVKVNELAMKPAKILAGKIERATIIESCIGKNSIVRAGAYVKGSLIGENCEIGENSVIKSSAIGNNVKIGGLCYIENSVICDNVTIEAGCFIKDSVIDRGCVIEPKFTALSGLAEIRIGDELHHVKAGVFIGERCEIKANVVAKAGTVIGNDVKIEPSKVVSGFIPDNTRVL